eukprot:s4191_g2.t1
MGEAEQKVLKARLAKLGVVHELGTSDGMALGDDEGGDACEFDEGSAPRAWEAQPAQPLQTVSVSHQEVLKKIEEWKGSIGDELSNVFDVHEAMRPGHWTAMRVTSDFTSDVHVDRNLKGTQNLFVPVSSFQKGALLAALTIYVDDLLLSGTPEVSEAVWKAIQSKWKISTPEYADEGLGITFCGFEIKQDSTGIRVGQAKYVQSLLDKYPEIVGTSSCPYAKESEVQCQPQESIEKLRRAQALVGELLWLATRTRTYVEPNIKKFGMEPPEKDMDQEINYQLIGILI